MLVFLIVVVGILALLRFHQIIEEIAYSRVAFEREKGQVRIREVCGGGPSLSGGLTFAEGNAS
jgi:hypothetical protein